MRMALRAGRARPRDHPPQPRGGRGGRRAAAACVASGYHAARRRPARRDRRPRRRWAAARAGATLYVTLEPCCHTGRTGPCTAAVLAAGRARVVVGCSDENPSVAGKGIARLRARRHPRRRRLPGGRVPRGQPRLLRLDRASGGPLVTLKAAATLDGFIAPARRRRARGSPLDHRPGGARRRRTSCAPATTPSWSAPARCWPTTRG